MRTSDRIIWHLMIDAMYGGRCSGSSLSSLVIIVLPRQQVLGLLRGSRHRARAKSLSATSLSNAFCWRSCSLVADPANTPPPHSTDAPVGGEAISIIFCATPISTCPTPLPAARESCRARIDDRRRARPPAIRMAPNLGRRALCATWLRPGRDRRGEKMRAAGVRALVDDGGNSHVLGRGTCLDHRRTAGAFLDPRRIIRREPPESR